MVGRTPASRTTAAPDDLTSPWHAAWASLAAFTCGVGALRMVVTHGVGVLFGVTTG